MFFLRTTGLVWFWGKGFLFMLAVPFLILAVSFLMHAVLLKCTRFLFYANANGYFFLLKGSLFNAVLWGESTRL